MTVEIRSVNHRFLEVACRLPRPLSHLEDAFKKAIQQRCTRGRIDIAVTVGVAAHGIGTARAFQVSGEAGAFAGLAFALHGLFAALAFPAGRALVQWLL